MTVDAEYEVESGYDPRSQIPEDKSMAVLAHLSSFGGYVIPFGNIIGPLIFYLIKKDQCPYTRAHAASSLNFQISLTIWLFISLILAFVLIGFLFIIVLAIMDLVCTILGAVRASNGEYYDYPLTIRFVS